MKKLSMSHVRIGLVALCMTALTACGTFKATCAKPDDYAGAKELPPLEVPAGLEAPDTRAALKVPELIDPERPRTDEDGCLDHPPKFAQPKTPAPQA
ncbi:MAG TPA: hypothetical protein P5528_10215 [Steroidobacteraceae bacterium]|nr:hypothetical protein [Steroidobacteraceae bacterium]HRX89807.1 hypothetical protein [Steroidobacteraceae bacterium]